jgi:energy-coupling factor transporter ATP-binding protein EcfA2
MVTDTYPIRCIKLINFHNFTNETIDLEENGHLFLLGDNGCGKTTILDAIHYALTAGMGMEWNSAARMSGSKRDGRRVQGVVLRYNLDTGIIHKNGAISYVALEFSGRHGKPLTIGVGISATAMDERIGFWAVIRECAISELPFVIEEAGEFRPASRQEFKQGLEGSRGFFTSQAGYRREIGERLFGGAESYKDICRFLAMGKSYREISAGAADYHQLFKRLLPEPGTTIFEQIIDGLRSIDESQALLDDLERKLNWLSALGELRDDVARHRIDILRYRWLLQQFSIEQSEKEKITFQNLIQQGDRQLVQAGEQLAKRERAERELEERLANLQTKDSSGLVRQEKSCRLEFDNKKIISDREKQTTKELQRELQKQAKENEKLLTDCKIMLSRLLPELATKATTLPFTINDLQGEIDGLSRAPDLFTSPEPKIYPYIERSDSYIQQTVTEQTLLTEQQKTCSDEIAVQEARLAELELQNNIYPELNGYHQLLQLAQTTMLVPRPLYMGLEWSAVLKKQERDYIEECIGEKILSTILFRDAEYPAARELVSSFPQIRISSTSRIARDLPGWMRQVFDIQRCDPDCLRCLASEMESSGLDPQVSQVNGQPMLAFRSHERVLKGHSARHIGSDSRKKALAREIKTGREQLKTLIARKKELIQAVTRVEKQQNDLTEFKSFLYEKSDEIRKFFRLGTLSEEKLNHCQLRFDNQQQTLENLEQELKDLQLRLGELGELIAKEGLINLDRKIKRVKKTKDNNRRASDELKEKIGGEKNKLQDLGQRLETLESSMVDYRQQMARTEANLGKLLPDVDDLAHYVLKTRKGQQFKSRESITREIDNCRVAAGTGVEKIKMQLNNPEFGGAFRFSYEEQENELYNFRQQKIAAIIEQQTLALKEQQEVISERTRELFKKIILTDLMQYLRRHVGELDQMIRRINTLLRNRSFGGQRYSFRIRPQEQYLGLINIIKKFSPFDPDAAKELEDFFRDHRDAIIATEVGNIPEELDYRNWYRYEMEVATIGEEGKVMDRRNKSIGSGGEQAVPNYLLILTIAHFMYRGKNTRVHALLFDEAFYGIDAGRRDQILGFATDLGLQLFIASPDQDGVRREVRHSTTLLVKKDINFDIHLYPFHWQNPANRQLDLFNQGAVEKPVQFDKEI